MMLSLVLFCDSDLLRQRAAFDVASGLNDSCCRSGPDGIHSSFLHDSCSMQTIYYKAVQWICCMAPINVPVGITRPK